MTRVFKLSNMISLIPAFRFTLCSKSCRVLLLGKTHILLNRRYALGDGLYKDNAKIFSSRVNRLPFFFLPLWEACIWQNNFVECGIFLQTMLNAVVFVIFLAIMYFFLKLFLSLSHFFNFFKTDLNSLCCAKVTREPEKYVYLLFQKNIYTFWYKRPSCLK